MSQRGRSRSGRPAPGGRPARRGSGPDQGSRRPRRARTAAPTAAASHTRPAESSSDPAGRRGEDTNTPSRSRGTRRPGRAPAPARTERTFFGLSTGRAVILGVVICALTLTLAVPLRTYLTQRGEADRLTAERMDLEEQLAELERQKEQIDDPAWIASQGRERLGLVRPGEIPYKVQLPGDYQPPEEDAPPPPPSTGAWHSDLWQQLTGPLPTTEDDAETEPAAPVVPVPAPEEPGVPTG